MNAEPTRPIRAAIRTEFIDVSILDRRKLPGSAAFALLYLALSFWLHRYDVYNRFFTQAGPIYAVYHFFKVIAIFYIVWLICFIGLALLDVIQRHSADFALTELDRLITAFYTGGAVIAMGMFVLGWLHLYYTPVILVLTAPAIFVSFPYLQRIAESAWDHVRRASGEPRFKIQAALASAGLLLLGYLLVNKGFFPTTDHDGLTHYIPYYVTVIRTHGIAPNEVWYHYFYSRGSGLMFLGMLLTDETGQALVSFCMVLGASAVVYTLSKKMHGSIEWSMAAVIVYVSTMVFEPLQFAQTQRIHYPLNTAVFEKQHVMMASLIVGLIFMIAMMRMVPAGMRWWWTGLCALLAAHLAIFVPTAIAFVLPTFLVYTAYYALRDRSEAYQYAAIGGVAIAVVSCILVSNYLMVGMPDVNMTRLMWRITNQQKFSQWISPYLVAYLNEGSQPGFATLTLQRGYSTADWFYNVFQFERIRFLMPGVLVAIAAAGFSKTLRKTLFPADFWRIATPVIILLLTSGATTLVFNQPASIFRYFIFTTPLLVLIAVSVWFFVIGLAARSQRHNQVLTAAAILLACAALVYMVMFRGNAVYPKIQAGLLLGRISFEDAFMEHGLDWPALVEAKRQVGIEERILALNNDAAIGAVPGRPVETEINYGYPNWHLMAFGAPDVARAAFQKEGINYFIVRLRYSLTSALPHSPLFAPGTLNDYFDVVYATGDTYLLTWKGRAKRALRLPQEAVETLNRKIHSWDALPDLYNRMKLYFERNHGAAYPLISDPRLPPVVGFQ